MKEYDKTGLGNFKEWQKNLIIDVQCLKLKIWRHITTVNAIEQQYHFKTLDKYHKKKNKNKLFKKKIKFCSFFTYFAFFRS